MSDYDLEARLLDMERRLDKLESAQPMPKRKRDQLDEVGAKALEFLKSIPGVKMSPGSLERNVEGLPPMAGRLRWMAKHDFILCVEEEGKNPLYYWLPTEAA